MPRTADPTDIPRRLTDAGYLLFNRHGYNATGIQQITDQAGVPKGSFYNHFGSKEAFAAQILRHYADWVDEAWDLCLADAPADALGAIRHAFARFVEQTGNRDAGLVIIGDGAQKEEFAKLAADLGLRKRVLFPGFQQNPYPWLAASDIFAVTSTNEGLPNALLEAMYLGNAPISTRAGGVDEVFHQQ